MSKKIPITGGTGFITHHILIITIKTTSWKITSLDRLDYSGNLNRISDMMKDSIKKKKG